MTVEFESTEITVKFNIRQAQSLLMFMREIEGLEKEWKGTHLLPKGVMSDIRDLKSEFECLLMMADQRLR